MASNQKISEAKRLEILKEFVEGFLDSAGVRQFPSYNDLAKRHGLHHNTIYGWSRKDDWQAQKNEFHKRLGEKKREASVKSMVDASQAFDERCLQGANNMIARILRRLQTAREHEQNELRGGKVVEAIKPSELHQMSATLMNAQKIGKLALGEAQEIQKVTADGDIPDSFVELCRLVEGVGQRKAEEGNHIIN